MSMSSTSTPPVSAQSTRPPEDSQARISAFMKNLQESICAGLERLDGGGQFREDMWERPEGGGGRSRVIREGNIFEQGGVNFSEVFGDKLPPLHPQTTARSRRPWLLRHRNLHGAASSQPLYSHRSPQLPLL